MDERIRVSPLFILEHRTFIRICAPMVRYSKLPFRELVRNYGTDLVKKKVIFIIQGICSNDTCEFIQEFIDCT